VRELAATHTVNPMTISKAYSLLEAEGLLRRNRGRPMTVTDGRKVQESLAQRMKQLEPQAAHLVTAARQLELTGKELITLVRRTWEQDDE
jgi:GntR family transcriptional regulator